MTGSLTLNITVEEDGTVLNSVSATEGMADEEVLQRILAASLSFATTHIQGELQAADPGLNATILSEMAATHARIFVLHELMHLPDASS